jgi:hypothetical protein
MPTLFLLIFFHWNIDWAANPVLITIDRTDYPVENLPFPTVTVWPEDNESNCFEFVTKIFDFFKFPCFDDE